LDYRPTEIINVGFADRAITIDEIETGEIKRSLPGSHSAAIVAYVRAIGLQAEDEQIIELKSPHGQVMPSTAHQSCHETRPSISSRLDGS